MKTFNRTEYFSFISLKTKRLEVPLRKRAHKSANKSCAIQKKKKKKNKKKKPTLNKRRMKGRLKTTIGRHFELINTFMAKWKCSMERSTKAKNNSNTLERKRERNAAYSLYSQGTFEANAIFGRSTKVITIHK